MTLSRIVCAALLCGAASAQTTNRAKAICAPPANYRPDLELDGNTAETLSGRTQFPVLQEVKVLVHRLNPFRYQYRATYTSRPLEAEAVAEFLKFLNVPPEAKEAKEAGTGGGTLSARPPDGAQCPTAAAGFRRQSIQPAEEKLAAARNAVRAKRAEVERINDLIAAISVEMPDCNAVVREAEAVRKLLDTVADLATLEMAVKQAESAVNGNGGPSLRAQLDQWATANPTCETSKAQLSAGIESVKAGVDAVRKDTTRLSESLNSEESAKTRRALGGRLDAVLDASEPFYYRFSLPKPMEPTIYEIRLARQEMFPTPGNMINVGDPIKVRVGLPRFTLSGGFGVSSIGERNVISQAGPGGSVFAYDEGSHLRPALVVLGTGHVWRSSKRDFSFGLSTGFLAGRGPEETEVEYVAGPTFGFLGNLMLVTPGVHIGRRIKIAQYGIGGKVPDALPDPLPVQKQWKPGLVLAVTFRIK